MDPYISREKGKWENNKQYYTKRGSRIKKKDRKTITNNFSSAGFKSPNWNRMQFQGETLPLGYSHETSIFAKRWLWSCNLPLETVQVFIQ